jgi:7-cyano-7-deazaguanine synthase
MNKKAVLLMSGGMDSAVVTAWTVKEGFDCAALHLNYGQKTQERELEAFHDICSHFGIENRLVVDVSFLAQIGGSSLTDDTIEVSDAVPGSQTVPSSYVPFRNANILAIATSWAEVINAEAIIIGAMEEDSSGYPDCRESFYDAFQKAIELGTKPETNIQILTPIIHSKKSEIVKMGLELNVPFDKTWSCYKSSDFACGKCDSCHLRLKGFAEAGEKDPIPYKI